MNLMLNDYKERGEVISGKIVLINVVNLKIRIIVICRLIIEIPNFVTNTNKLKSALELYRNRNSIKVLMF